MLWRYALHLAADGDMARDAIQALFARLWERRDRLGEVDSVQGYLFRALRHILLDERQRESRSRDLAPLHALPQTATSAEEDWLLRDTADEQQAQVSLALAALTPVQREIIHLRFYSGLDYHHIAEVMGVNYQTARNYMSSALKRMKHTLKH